MTRPLSLDALQPLGRSSVKVSPLCLSAASIGLTLGRSTALAEATRVFDAYVERGGNFIDVSGPGGTAEHFVGRAARGKRESLVIARKYVAKLRPGDPVDGSGQHAMMRRSVEASLCRLGTDRLDLLYLQTWHGALPPQEAMRGLDDLVQSGKVRHVAIANAPGWRVAEMQIAASRCGWSPLVALQAEYNLVQRKLEHDLGPIATALDLGVVASSPLAAGLLSGAHRRAGIEAPARSPARRRLSSAPTHSSLTDRTFAVIDAVDEVAKECGATPAQVALAWTLINPAVAASVIDVFSLEQLDEQLAALALSLSRRQQARLESISATALPLAQPTLPRVLPVPRILDATSQESRVG